MDLFEYVRTFLKPDGFKNVRLISATSYGLGRSPRKKWTLKGLGAQTLKCQFFPLFADLFEFLWTFLKSDGGGAADYLIIGYTNFLTFIYRPLSVNFFTTFCGPLEFVWTFLKPDGGGGRPSISL